MKNHLHFSLSGTALPVSELESIVSRLASSTSPINPEVKSLIHRSNLSKLVSIYQSVMIQKQNIHCLTGSGSIIAPSNQQTVSSPSSLNCIPPSMNQSSCDLMQEIISILQEEVSEEITLSMLLIKN